MSYFAKSSITFARFSGVRKDVAATTSAVAGSAISSGVYLIYVHNTATDRAFVRVNDGTAASVTAANGFPIEPNTGYHFECTPGQTVSAILNSGTGTIVVCEMTK
jgi:FtsP/CotA-like multicopper oxidase with cupredoxin domain